MEEIRNKKYTQINEAERELIERLLRNNTPKKQIARMLNRSITTIRKEIKRGSVEQRKEIKTTKKDANIPIYQTELVYFADVGQRVYNENRSHCGRKCKIIECRDFLNYVEQQVKSDKLWSLDAAAGNAKRLNLFEQTVTTQTLYNWVDLGLCNVKNIDLLKKAGWKTHPKKVREHKKCLGRSIDERPSIVDSRLDFGHWEGDGIVGKDHKGHWITLIERKTRMGFVFNVEDKQSIRIVEVIDKMESMFGALFPLVFKTITFDNGTEFSNSALMEGNRRTKIYYAHPYSSWERGSNENWNGLVRRYFPKGTSFDNVQDDDLQRIQHMINNLPRKMFNYKSSREMFTQELQTLIETQIAVA